MRFAEFELSDPLKSGEVYIVGVNPMCVSMVKEVGSGCFMYLTDDPEEYLPVKGSLSSVLRELNTALKG